MKYLPLVFRNLLRRKVRTIFTVLSIFIAFLLFGILMTIRAAFGFGVQIASARAANKRRGAGFFYAEFLPEVDDV